MNILDVQRRVFLSETSKISSHTRQMDTHSLPIRKAAMNTVEYMRKGKTEIFGNYYNYDNLRVPL